MLSEERLRNIEVYLGGNDYLARPSSYVRPLLATVRELQARVAEMEIAAAASSDPDDDCECVVRTALEARVAELEPDAKLGKMVREMPGGASIAREPGQKVRFSAVWPSGTRDKNGWMHYSERCYEDTPGAALEAAQKGEP